MRDWAIENPRTIILILILVLEIAIYLTPKVEMGEVIDRRTITDRKNKYVKMDEEVGKLYPTEVIRFTFKEKLDCREDLVDILKFSEGLRKVVPRGILVSPTKIPNYYTTETLLAGTPVLEDHLDPFIPNEVKESNFDFSKWIINVRRNTTKGRFFSDDFQYTYLYLVLPRNYNGWQVYWNIAEYVEGRNISWWEKIRKYEIQPLDQRWSLGGWTVARFMIHILFFRDIFERLLAVGIPLAFIFIGIRFGIAAGMASVVMVLICLLATRSTIFVLNWAKIPFPEFTEKVYLLLCYAAIMVQGTSFALRRFHTFFKEWSKGRSEKEAWKVSKKIDILIGWIFVMSAGGFFSLIFSFPLSTMQELGVLSTVGVIYLYALSSLALPSLYSLFVWMGVPRKIPGQKNRWIKINFLIDKITYSSVVKPARGAAKLPQVVTLILLGLFAIAALFAREIKVGTSPLDFIKHTHFTKTALGTTPVGGFDTLDIMFRVKLTDPQSLRELSQFQEELKKIPDTKIVISIIDDIAQFSKEYPLPTPLPKTEADAKLALEKIEDYGMDTETLNLLYTENTVKFSIFNSAVLNTAEFRLYWQKIERLLETKHPTLKYYFGGKPLLWSLQDQIITRGKPINVATSEVMLILIRALMVFFAFWTVGRHKILFAFSILLLLMPTMSWRTDFTALVVTQLGALGIILLVLWTKGKASKAIAISFTNGVVMTIPLLFASAVLVILMIIFSWKLDQANAAIMALALNASIDLSVYWMHSYQAKKRLGYPWKEAIREVSKEEGRPLLDDVIVNILVFCPLMLSHFGPIRVLGIMLGAMLLATLYGTMIFMPAVLGIGSWFRGGNKKQ